MQTIIVNSAKRWPHNQYIQKVNKAMELAQKEEKLKPKPTLLPDFAAYNVFEKPKDGELPPSQPYNHAINLTEDFVPKVAKVYPLTSNEREAAERFVEDDLREGKIWPSKSPQAALFLFVGQKALISDLIDKLKGASVFTKMDVRSGYNNVHIKDGDQWKAAFITHKGLFKPTIMFFGLCNSPATFQRFINDSFQDMIAKGWLIFYMDDLLIFSDDPEVHRLCTLHVLQCMKELSLPLKLEKCHFNLPEVEYLGMVIRKNTIEMDPVKVKGIKEWPVPMKVKDVHFFLGFANFYHRFILDYSWLARPLIDLTKKSTTWEWSSKCQTAFDIVEWVVLVRAQVVSSQEDLGLAQQLGEGWKEETREEQTSDKWLKELS